MTVELVEALGGRFLGRRLTVVVAGTTVELDLDGLRAETDAPASSDLFTFWSELPGAREMKRLTRAVTGFPLGGGGAGADTVDRVIVEASDVTIDGHPVGDVVATIGDVRVSYGTAPELVTGPIELRVASSRSHVVAWLARRFTDWEVALAPGGKVAARPPGGRLTALVAPEGLDGDAVVLHVVGVRLLGRDVRLPRRLVRRVVQPLPALPKDLVLVGARVGDPELDIQLHHPGLRLPIRPEHLRAAVREGVGLLRFG
jgi:hypothetical protein